MRTMRTWLAGGAALAASAVVVPRAHAAIRPVGISGLNTDVIVENAGTPTNGAAAVTADGIYGTNQFALFERGSYTIANPFNAAGVAVPGGSAGLLPSRRYATDPGADLLTVQLAPYAGANNALRLTAASPAGTLALDPASQSAYSRLWLIGNSDNGAGTVDLTLNFADATTETITGVAVADWFSSVPAQEFAVGVGRVNNLASTTANPSFSGLAPGGARLFAAPVTVPAASAGKTLQSVTVTRGGALGASVAPTLFGLVGDTTAERSLSVSATTTGVQVQSGLLLPAVPGTAPGVNNFPAAEGPGNAVDSAAGTKYLNFAETDTGLIITPALAPGEKAILTGLTLVTANDAPERDPASYVLMGTNVVGAIDLLLSDYTVIAQGTLDLPTDRFSWIDIPVSSSAQYSSFLVYFPTVRDGATANSMQIADIQLRGTVVPEPASAAVLGLLAMPLLGRRRRGPRA